MENIIPFESPELSEIISKYSPFFIEARKRIIFTLVVFAVATFVGFAFYEKIIIFLIGALSLDRVNIVFTSPFQFINLAISTGIATGLVIVFPLFIVQVLYFLRPALREKEYKLVVRLLPFSAVLFLAGFALGAFVMKWQIQIFLERSLSLGIGNVLDISQLLRSVILTSALMGIGFQFPIVLLLLLRLRVIKHEMLSKRRLWIYLVSFLFAILLPADSILADVFLSLPLIILFEFTLILNRILERRSTR